MIKREDGSRIWLSEPLSYRHSGLGVLRAEVALLHRNIVIRGGNEAAPFDWEGESGDEEEGLCAGGTHLGASLAVWGILQNCVAHMVS